MKTRHSVHRCTKYTRRVLVC